MTAYALSLIATAGETQREYINPYVVGIATFVLLVLCLSFTLLFNRDR
jgi:hypothetical protein